MFQSIAGSEAANKSFGIDLALLAEAREAALALKRGTVGDNVMYFETGQGSALSAGAHHGVDQQTLEARAYAVARAFSPLLINTVVGFIGPEYLYDGKQIIRAGLEDHFCGKLLGLPMGCDVCYTNHAEADQDDMDALLTLLTAAGVNFVMGVPGADDIMLGYQSTSFHDALAMRDLLQRRPAPEFEAWLTRQGLIDAAQRIRPRVMPSRFLALLAEAHDAARSLRRGTVGENVMYFETGQGSALSAEAAHGVDQQTCEARAYGVCRRFAPLLVNTVVGFIGPEYLYDGKQIIRAGLEDHFCGKLLGLPMGCDVCYTNHAEADQDDMDALLTLLTAAGVNFVMGVPGADDIMLGYQSTSFHDALAVRDLLQRRPAPEFEAWLARQGLIDDAARIRPRAMPSRFRALLPA